MTPWWVSLVAAGIAVLGGAAGGWMTHLFTARRDRQQFDRLTARQDAEWHRQRGDKLRDVQDQLYLDLMEFLENLTQILAWHPLDDRPTPAPLSGLVHQVRLAARVRLYGNPQLIDAWAKVDAEYDAVIMAARHFGDTGIPDDLTDAASAAVTELQSLLRAELSSGEVQLPDRT